MNQFLKKLPLFPNLKAAFITGLITILTITVVYVGTLFIFN